MDFEYMKPLVQSERIRIVFLIMDGLGGLPEGPPELLKGFPITAINARR